MSWESRADIETPEQIEVHLEVVGPGSRMLAQVVDWVLKWLVLVCVGLAVFVVFSVAGGQLHFGGGIFPLVLGLVILAAFGFFFGYDIYYEGLRNGQTPGKHLAGIRVVREGGGPIDVRAACIRNLVGIADFLPAWYVLGGLVMLLNRRAQRLGDMAAGTLVIRDRRTVLPDQRPPWVEEAGDEFAFRTEELARCEPNDLHVLHSFFTRYRSLEEQARDRLADALRDRYLQKTGYQPAHPLTDPDEVYVFLAALYRDLDAYRRQH